MSEKMYTIQELVEMGEMPEIMAEDFDIPCKCGKHVVCNKSLTRYACSDDNCVHHMAMRGAYMADKVGARGYGQATCINTIRDYNISDHIDLLPVMTDGYKPKLKLWEIADIACIPGYSTKLDDILSGYNSFEEYFSKSWANHDLKEHEDRLKRLESYCNIKRELSSDKLKIMITDDICMEGYENAFPNKESFVDACNKFIGHIFEVQSLGEAIDRSVLICDTKNVNIENGTTGKWKMARKILSRGGNIKIMTSRQFMLWLGQVKEKYDTEGHI